MPKAARVSTEKTCKLQLYSNIVVTMDYIVSKFRLAAAETFVRLWESFYIKDNLAVFLLVATSG